MFFLQLKKRERESTRQGGKERGRKGGKKEGGKGGRKERWPEGGKGVGISRMGRSQA